MFDFKPIKINSPKFKSPKLEKVIVPKMRITKEGERTLTSAQKRKLKEDVNFKCERCHKKFNPRYLEIHHKKAIHKHKSAYGVAVPTMTMGKKYIPAYDRRKSNLEVVCLECHDITKRKPKKKATNNSLIGFKPMKFGGF